MDNCLFEVVKNCQSWTTDLITKLWLCQKIPKHPLKQKNIDKKTLCPRLLECPERHVFKFPTNKKRFLRVCLIFLAKKSLVLSALKQKILDEIKQSKSSFSRFCVSFFLTKEMFVGKCLQKWLIPITWNISRRVKLFLLLHISSFVLFDN